ncbi:retrovirus-related pol polyprotein from transposon TNT 1-94 [Tanacetum coccineum]
MGTNERYPYGRRCGCPSSRYTKDIYTTHQHFTDAKDIRDNVKMIREGLELTKQHECIVNGEQNDDGKRNNARGNVVVGNAGGQNRDGNVNPSQAKPIMCYNCKGIGHITRECPHHKSVLRDSGLLQDKMLLMNAHENGVVLNEEQLLFLTGEQVTNFDDNVDDLALNVDHVFEADSSDAFDF